jgi:hypothetical protein
MCVALLVVVSGTSAATGGVVKRPHPLSLAVQARLEVRRGGIYGTCYGCASSRLKSLTAALIRQRFGVYAARALCFARRESGLNPGAISSTDDHGAFQINRPTHGQFSYWLMDHDPAYGVQAGWVVSDHGTNWGPWAGGRYTC